MSDFLILKLEGPMQSWGGHTYEDYRPSEVFPTKSAVIGLLAACLGIDRQDKKRQLQLAGSIHLAIRPDSHHYPVARITDFHTVERARKVDGKQNKHPVVSRREYLCDASFTLAIQIEGNLFALSEIKRAIQQPVFTPFLGRKSCPLTRPLFHDVVSAATFTEALQQVAPGEGVFYSDVDENADGRMQMRDIPIARHRQFATRQVYIHSGVFGNVSQ